MPIVYQLLKSVGHSTMALAQVVGPYIDNPDDKSWRGSMLAYRSRMQSALDGLDATPMEPGWRDNNRTILQNNIAFMDECVAKGVIPFAALEAFGKKQAPYLAKNVAWAAQTQVAHWMTVLAEWKTQLGADWDKTYAASNTIYVARQNNVLFSVLAQFFGPDAINSRLLLIETVSFTTTPADMLESLTRIIADRSVGALFFGNYHLMDYELMGGDARAAIAAETGKRGMTPFLPPVVPFGSKQWPTLVTPGPGPHHRRSEVDLILQPFNADDGIDRGVAACGLRGASFVKWVSASGIALSLSRLGRRKRPASTARVASGTRGLESGRQWRGPDRRHRQGHRRKTLRIRFPRRRPAGLAGEYLARDAGPRAGRDTRLYRNGSCAAWRRDEAVGGGDRCRSRQDRHPRSRILYRRPVLSGRQDAALSGAAGRRC